MFKSIVYCMFVLCCVECRELSDETEISDVLNDIITEVIQRQNLTSFIENITQDVFGYYNIKSVFDEICKLDGFPNVSRSCVMQIEVLCNNFHLVETMFDATAKFPYPGMNYATRMVLGNYDECMTIDHSDNKTRVLGKYCIAGMIIPDFKNISNHDLVHKLDICIPDQCSAIDLRSIGNAFNLPLVLLDNFCSTKGSGMEFTAASIIVTSLFLAIIWMMLICTVYDVYLYQTEQKPRHPLFLAFSVLSNGKVLLSSSQYSRDRIGIFDGMRVISMMWIIAGHGFGTFLFGSFSVLNQASIDGLHEKRYSGYIDAAHVAVDTFIFISGFLLSYHYLKDLSRSAPGQLKNIPFMYMHRYLRITPPVLMLYLSTLFILPKFGTGPFWEHGIDMHLKPCREYWWSYLLFIQNYVNWDNLCLVPHWYLSVDIQCFMVAPLFLIPTSQFLRKPNGFKYSMIFLSILNLFCIFLPMIIWFMLPGYKNEYGTHSRLTDFLIGITMGVYLRTHKDEPFLKMFGRRKITMINVAIWTIVLVGMFTVLFFYQDAEVNQSFIQRLFYFGLSRPAWCISLCWIVYSCYHGYGGIVNWILTRPIFQFGSKLTYCMFIVHYTVIGHYSLSNRMKWYFSNYIEFYLWCGYFIETIIWALFWTLAFESPVIVLEKYLLGHPRKVDGKTTNQS